MRTIYLFLLAFLPVLCWSCYDDKGNYDYHELNRTEVTGIKPVYRCDLLSRLSIPTVIQSEDKGRTYDYVWMTYQTTGDKKIDTLSQEKDLDLFCEIADVTYKDYDDVPFVVLVPSFILSELRTAFIIGVIIYIPFIVIDMVVSSVLMSMGMMMLPPTTISLPFKILLFVLADGWNLVIGGLVKTFY